MDEVKSITSRSHIVQDFVTFDILKNEMNILHFSGDVLCLDRLEFYGHDKVLSIILLKAKIFNVVLCR